MSRTVGLLTLAQVATVICGFFGLAIILKHYGYPDEPRLFTSLAVYHWSDFTLFLRRFGMMLLLVPAAWGAVAVISNRHGECVLSHGSWLVIGTLLPFVLVAAFLYAIFRPCVAVPN